MGLRDRAAGVLPRLNVARQPYPHYRAKRRAILMYLIISNDGIMKRTSEVLSTLEASSERVAARLAEEPINRHRLLDMATALIIISHALRRVEQDLAGRAPGNRLLNAERALDQLDDCLLLVRRHSDVSEAEVRGHLEEAARHAMEALRVFRDLDSESRSSRS